MTWHYFVETVFKLVGFTNLNDRCLAPRNPKCCSSAYSTSFASCFQVDPAYATAGCFPQFFGTASKSCCWSNQISLILLWVLTLSLRSLFSVCKWSTPVLICVYSAFFLSLHFLADFLFWSSLVKLLLNKHLKFWDKKMTYLFSLRLSASKVFSPSILDKLSLIVFSSVIAISSLGFASLINGLN